MVGLVNIGVGGPDFVGVMSPNNMGSAPDDEGVAAGVTWPLDVGVISLGLKRSGSLFARARASGPLGSVGRSLGSRRWVIWRVMEKLVKQLILQNLM